VSIFFRRTSPFVSSPPHCGKPLVVCGMRRKPGVAGIQANAEALKRMREQGQVLTDQSTQALQEQIEAFRSKLQTFAMKHRHEINKNPEFRHQFHQMCSALGVDPLASKKGFWAELLGYGDFYYELAVQVIDVCLATRRQNGGLMPLNDVTRAVVRRRPPAANAVTDSDVEQAVAKVASLGSGFKVVTLALGAPEAGGGKMVQSVPLELTVDTSAVLALAQARATPTPLTVDGATVVTTRCCLTGAEVAEALGWPPTRSHAALAAILKTGMAWLDADAVHWFPMFCRLA